MKSPVFALLPLLAYAAPTQDGQGSIMQKRQYFPSLGGNPFGPPKQAIVLKTLSPEVEPSAKREIKMWGPFKIQASNATHGGIGFSNGIKLDPNSDTISGMISAPCLDCTILKAVANLAYKDGKQADVDTGVYTHHIIMTQNGRMQLPNPIAPPSNCFGNIANSVLSGSAFGSNQQGDKIGGSSHSHSKRQELSSWLSAFIPKVTVFVGGGGSVGSGSAFAVSSQVSNVRSGAYVGPKDTFQFSSEIVNYDPVEKDIYLTLDFEWVPGKTKNLLNVGMGSIALDCTSFQFQPPKDKAIIYPGQNWTMTDNGYFVNFTPHVHDGASNIKVFLNEEQVCEIMVQYGANNGVATLDGSKKWETISGYSPCAYMKHFKKGDKLRMTAEYDLTKHILRPDSKNHEMDAEGMAMANFIWAKENP